MAIKPLRLTFLALLLLSVLAACGPAEEPSTPWPAVPTETVPSGETPSPTDASPPSKPSATPAPGEPTPLPVYDAQPLPTDSGALFSASGACAACHNNLTDAGGSDVSIDTDWRSAMMANAARDPYWQAAVRSEVLDNPHLELVIEDKCATCHTPMAHTAAVVSGAETNLLDAGFLEPDHPDHTFAIDGVSCTLCHQIEERGLDDAESFSGGFSIDPQRPPGERLVYGPFPPVPGPASMMQRASGYRPVEGPQTLRSELCATCHTLYTPYVDQGGEVAGTFPEQVPYLEWQHSAYADTHACQDCHMPPAQGAVRLASTGGGPPRRPFGIHRFIGGNVYVLNMLWAFGEDLGVTAASDHFARKVDQTLDQLQNRTAAVTVESLTVAEGRLSFDVVVENQAGHKFPTGFPARRAWLRVTVQDNEGNVVFASGAINPDGSIVGNDNDADAATTYEPHYQEISGPDQVQIYEPILEDVSGEVTTGLLRASRYRKDNRLLPSGFDKASAGEDVAVYGAAADDDDFGPGGDTVRYLVDLTGAQGALTVRVELLYQSIGYRWAEDLRRHDAAEIARFLTAYDALPNQPVVVAQATAALGP
ncbi:MAG: hypothetical protein ACOC7N_05550 [Chloroflexota bacterium]